MQQSLVISIVSHGHGSMVQQLLEQLSSLVNSNIKRVILTQNFPEAEPYSKNGSWPFILEIRKNEISLGFSENHNQALADASEDFFCILNPDVEFSYGNPFPTLMEMFEFSNVGLAYPVQVDSVGVIQDSERVIPTVVSLWRRHIYKCKENRAEWVNAAFWVVRSSVWRQISGLNTKFFMYCEDVDFCLRLRLAGWTLARAETLVLHAGLRSSRRRLIYAYWHMKSLIYLWTSSVFWKARRLVHNMTDKQLITIKK